MTCYIFAPRRLRFVTSQSRAAGDWSLDSTRPVLLSTLSAGAAPNSLYNAAAMADDLERPGDWYTPANRTAFDGPLTNKANRSEWVEDAGKRTALEYKSYFANKMSKNTLHRMLLPENLALADADGGGTIDKSEFSTLLAASGGLNTDMQATLLFAAADKDGDGELTIDEIKNSAKAVQAMGKGANKR